MNRIAALLIFIFASNAANSEALSVLINNCWENHSHVEMSECVAAEARKASAELASTEKSVIDAISKKDESVQYRKAMQVAFESSKKTYQKFRVSQCDFEASQAAGGNATHDLKAACETELDLNRAKELRAWVARGQN